MSVITASLGSRQRETKIADGPLGAVVLMSYEPTVEEVKMCVKGPEVAIHIRILISL